MPQHLLIALLFCPALLAQAPSTQTPDAASLVAQHLEACGGAARLRAVQSRRIHYQLSGLTPFDIPMVVEQKRPCPYRRECSILGTTQLNAFDGHAGCKLDPIVTFSTTPEALTASEPTQMDEDATFDTPLLDYAAKGHRVEFLGQELRDGRALDLLRLTLKGGEAMNVYLDARSHLAVRWTRTEHQKKGDLEIATTLGDYRTVQGIAYPYLIEIAPKDGAWHMKLVAEKVEAGIPLDAARFRRPDAPATAVASK